MAQVGEAERLKDEGNKQFAKGHYKEACDAYSAALALDPSNKVLYSNRSFANLRLENYGLAIADATECLKLDPTFVKGYYRRASAYLSLLKYQEALQDFAHVVKIEPSSKEARDKYEQCKQAITKARFEAAISMDHGKKPLSETIDANSMAVDSDYKGPHLPATITLEFVQAMIEEFRQQRKLHRKYVVQLLLLAKRLFSEMPTLVQIHVDSKADLTVCGDVHGQYYDLLNIFQLNGNPSEKNMYLFNGDFVDRGSFSCEVIITLLAWKCLYPNHFFLARGNHESRSMTKMYGFEGEVKAKYSDTIYDLFMEVFDCLPLVHIISNDSGKKIFVTHGGIFGRDGVTLDDIRRIDRFREPPQEGLMSDLLWADPQPAPGRLPSKRGVGYSFGPDVTARFLKDTNCEMIIRSHEVKQRGYEWEADGKLITIFSAPNYCDQVGNQGAYIRFGEDLSPQISCFDAVPHPAVRPMSYANPLFSM